MVFLTTIYSDSWSFKARILGSFTAQIRELCGKHRITPGDTKYKTKFLQLWHHTLLSKCPHKQEPIILKASFVIFCHEYGVVEAMVSFRGRRPLERGIAGRHFSKPWSWSPPNDNWSTISKPSLKLTSNFEGGLFPSLLSLQDQRAQRTVPFLQLLLECFSVCVER